MARAIKCRLTGVYHHTPITCGIGDYTSPAMFLAHELKMPKDDFGLIFAIVGKKRFEPICVEKGNFWLRVF